MPLRPILKCIALLVGSIVIALVLLPSIAGLIEGDSGYLRWELTRGWINEKNTSFADALSDVYAWSLWRIGLGNTPISYVIYLTDKVNIEMSKLPPLKG